MKTKKSTRKRSTSPLAQLATITAVALIFCAGVGMIAVQTVQRHQKVERAEAQISESRAPLVTPSPTIPASAEVRRWMLAAGGPIAQQNGENWDDLASNIPVDELKYLVQAGWDISDRDSALQTIYWLRDEGHRHQFNNMRRYILAITNDDEAVFKLQRRAISKELLVESPSAQLFLTDFVWKHRNDLAEKSLSAWDYSRLINVVRWSYALGYLSEDEAWENITLAARELQKHHTSWDDFADSYLLGRTFWQHSSANAGTVSAVRQLQSDPKSPWRTLPWNLPL